MLKDLFFENTTNVSKEHNDELQLEVAQLNIYRDRFLAIALIVLSAIVVGFHIVNASRTTSNPTAYRRFIYLYLTLIIAGAAFLVFTGKNKCINEDKLRLLRIAHTSLNTTVLVFCAIISIYAASMNQLPFTYVIATFSIGTLEILELKERRIIYIVPYLVHFIGILFVKNDIFLSFKSLIYFTIITILALVISGTNYLSYMKNFVNNKIILKKNEELQELQKITEEALERRTEELNKTVEYEKLRTAFFANISHELRTPLNLIFSAEQLLELITSKNPVPGKQKEFDQYMSIMRQNCYRLIRLIANLIDTTKIDAGYFNVNLKNCDIIKVVEDITLSAVYYIENRNINLVFDTEVEEMVLACDPDKIERIILNLLSNAVKFTPGEGTIEVNIQDKEDILIISVKDTGIGVPAEMQSMIFERFVQVDKSITRSKEGSGIGLSIVKSLVEMHNGTISLISEAGKGSEFIIALPKVIITEEQTAKDNNLVEADNRIEKVNIEFSDIYI